MHYQSTQPIPCVISFLKQVKNKVAGLLLRWHEVCMCVRLSFICVLTSDCFSSLSVRAHYCFVLAELKVAISTQL